MGHFSYVCALSGLTIHGGDKVRAFLITKNHHGNDGGYSCGGEDKSWVIRTGPLKAIYDGYGRIENEKGVLMRAVWLKMFSRDIVEKDLGDNSCHDSPVSRKMTVAEIGDAIHEGRLEVWQRKIGGEAWNLHERKAPKGFPTVSDVKSLIHNCGMDKKLRCYAISPGWVMVTPIGYPSADDKKSYFEIFTDYAMGQTHGWEFRRARRPYSDGVVVSVQDDSAAEVYGLRAVKREKRRAGLLDERSWDLPRRTPVSWCLVREDVWQVALKADLSSFWWAKKDDTMEKKITDLRSVFDAVIRDFRDEEKIIRAKELCKAVKEQDVKAGRKLSMSPLRYIMIFHDHKFMDLGFRDTPCVAGLVSCMTEAALMVAKKPSMEKYVDRFLREMVEVVHVNIVSSLVSVEWRPPHGGPQDGEWEFHTAFLNSIRGIAQKHVDQRARWRDE